ncbi:Spindle_pole protein [Hexamita inflata]|uniref:Putative n=1 Tax=Hexamita inflata TaxID=28002 RepID=A0ABP1HP10_9EUKA
MPETIQFQELHSRLTRMANNVIDQLEQNISTRELYVMFEKDLLCNPKVDHLFPKNVLPVFQNTINYTRMQLTSNLLPIIAECINLDLYTQNTSIDQSIYIQLQMVTEQLKLQTEISQNFQKEALDLEKKLAKQLQMTQQQLLERQRYGKIYNMDGRNAYMGQDDPETAQDKLLIQIRQQLNERDTQVHIHELEIKSNHEHINRLLNLVETLKMKALTHEAETQTDVILESRQESRLKSRQLQVENIVRQAYDTEDFKVLEFILQDNASFTPKKYFRKQTEIKEVIKESPRDSQRRNFIFDRQGTKVSLDQPKFFDKVNEGQYVEKSTKKTYYINKDEFYVYKDENNLECYIDALGRMNKIASTWRAIENDDGYLQLSDYLFITPTGTAFHLDSYKNAYTPDKLPLTHLFQTSTTYQSIPIIDLISSNQIQLNLGTQTEFYDNGQFRSILELTRINQNTFIDDKTQQQFQQNDEFVSKNVNGKQFFESNEGKQYLNIKGLYDTNSLFCQIINDEMIFQDKTGKNWGVDLQGRCLYSRIDDNTKYVVNNLKEAKEELKRKAHAAKTNNFDQEQYKKLEEMYKAEQMKVLQLKQEQQKQLEINKLQRESMLHQTPTRVINNEKTNNSITDTMDTIKEESEDTFKKTVKESQNRKLVVKEEPKEIIKEPVKEPVKEANQTAKLQMPRKPDNIKKPAQNNAQKDIKDILKPNNNQSKDKSKGNAINFQPEIKNDQQKSVVQEVKKGEAQVKSGKKEPENSEKIKPINKNNSDLKQKKEEKTLVKEKPIFNQFQDPIAEVQKIVSNSDQNKSNDNSNTKYNNLNNTVSSEQALKTNSGPQYAITEDQVANDEETKPIEQQKPNEDDIHVQQQRSNIYTKNINQENEENDSQQENEQEENTQELVTSLSIPKLKLIDNSSESIKFQHSKQRMDPFNNEYSEQNISMQSNSHYSERENNSNALVDELSQQIIEKDHALQMIQEEVFQLKSDLKHTKSKLTNSLASMENLMITDTKYVSYQSELKQNKLVQYENEQQSATESVGRLSIQSDQQIKLNDEVTLIVDNQQFKVHVTEPKKELIKSNAVDHVLLSQEIENVNNVTKNTLKLDEINKPLLYKVQKDTDKQQNSDKQQNQQNAQNNQQQQNLDQFNNSVEIETKHNPSENPIQKAQLDLSQIKPDTVVKTAIFIAQPHLQQPKHTFDSSKVTLDLPTKYVAPQNPLPPKNPQKAPETKNSEPLTLTELELEVQPEPIQHPFQNQEPLKNNSTVQPLPEKPVNKQEKRPEAQIVTQNKSSLPNLSSQHEQQQISQPEQDNTQSQQNNINDQNTQNEEERASVYEQKTPKTKEQGVQVNFNIQFYMNELENNNQVKKNQFDNRDLEVKQLVNLSHGEQNVKPGIYKNTNVTEQKLYQEIGYKTKPQETKQVENKNQLNTTPEQRVLLQGHFPKTSIFKGTIEIDVKQSVQLPDKEEKPQKEINYSSQLNNSAYKNNNVELKFSDQQPVTMKKINQLLKRSNMSPQVQTFNLQNNYVNEDPNILITEQQNPIQEVELCMSMIYSLQYYPPREKFSEYTQTLPPKLSYYQKVLKCSLFSQQKITEEPYMMSFRSSSKQKIEIPLDFGPVYANNDGLMCFKDGGGDSWVVLKNECVVEIEGRYFKYVKGGQIALNRDEIEALKLFQQQNYNEVQTFNQNLMDVSATSINIAGENYSRSIGVQCAEYMKETEQMKYPMFGKASGQMMTSPLVSSGIRYSYGRWNCFFLFTM